MVAAISGDVMRKTVVSVFSILILLFFPVGAVSYEGASRSYPVSWNLGEIEIETNPIVTVSGDPNTDTVTGADGSYTIKLDILSGTASAAFYIDYEITSQDIVSVSLSASGAMKNESSAEIDWKLEKIIKNNSTESRETILDKDNKYGKTLLYSHIPENGIYQEGGVPVEIVTERLITAEKGIYKTNITLYVEVG